MLTSLCYTLYQAYDTSVTTSMSRASMHPGASAQGSAAALKQRQVAQLATRLAEMSNRFAALDKQLLIASEHAQHIRQIGGQHAAL